MVAGAMVAGLAFLATAVATLFAEATFKRWRQGRKPHEAAWTVALALFALASAALATGASTIQMISSATKSTSPARMSDANTAFAVPARFA